MASKCGVRSERGRIVFFAAEGAAGLCLHDADFVRREIEDRDQRFVHVEGALQRAPHGDAVFRALLGNDAVVFDVEMFLRAGAVFAFDNMRGTASRRNPRRLSRAESF